MYLQPDFIFNIENTDFVNHQVKINQRAFSQFSWGSHENWENSDRNPN